MLEVMLEQLQRMELQEKEIEEKYEHRQAQRYARLRDLEEKETSEYTALTEASFNEGGGGSGCSGYSAAYGTEECEVSWSQVRTIEEHRNSFLNHRAIVEASLRGTGLSQGNVIEVMEKMLTEQLIESCCKEVEELMSEMTDMVTKDA